MALVRNNLSLRMKGRAGSFSFYSSKGRQVARVAQNSSNYGESARRSEAQQVRRVKWANLVNFYKIMGKTLHGAYESKRTNETDYNAFMRKNLPLATVALTKELAAMGCCCPQSFVVAEGTLTSPNFRIDTVGEDTIFTTDIAFVSSAVQSDDPISELSQLLISKNSWLKEGMQLTLLVFQPSEDKESPRTFFERHELTLNLNDSRKIGQVWGSNLPAGGATDSLCFPTLSTDCYAAFIVSDSTSGKLLVSSAKVIPGDTANETWWSAEDQVMAAMESYGVDPARFLDSGDLK